MQKQNWILWGKAVISTTKITIFELVSIREIWKMNKELEKTDGYMTENHQQRWNILSALYSERSNESWNNWKDVHQKLWNKESI